VKPSPLRVALRADASSVIGIGHVKRSLSLGQALLEAGATVCLVSRESTVDVAAMARGAGIAYVPVGAPRAGQDGKADEVDAAATSDALRDWRPDLVVVDGYAFDHRWHTAVRTALHVRLAAIDDVADRDFAVDWLIDHNHATDHRAKYEGHLPPGTRLLCGPRFALLSPAYAQAARHVLQDPVTSIGIFMGGTDAAGMSAVALDACRNVAGFRGDIEIVTTSGNAHLADLQRFCSQSPGTTLSIDLDDLAGFFARHGLQIGAGGGATWERCCIGAPSLALVCADNQRASVPALATLDVTAVLAEDAPNDAATIGAAVRQLIDAPCQRATLAANARRLVDGLGARRVALALSASHLALRPATIADAGMMHTWRNAPATRAVSTDDREIPLADHVAWLSRTLADPQRRLSIAEIGGAPVGVIRMDRHPSGDAEVSLYLDPDLHGLSLGGAMLRAAEQLECGAAQPPSRFVATVLPDNAASSRMFRAARYEPCGTRWTKPASPPLPGVNTP